MFVKLTGIKVSLAAALVVTVKFNPWSYTGVKGSRSSTVKFSGKLKVLTFLKL